MKLRVAAHYVSEHLTIDGVVTDLSPRRRVLLFRLPGCHRRGRCAFRLTSRGCPIRCNWRGEVRWVSEASLIGGMGIRFMDVSFEDRVVLSSLGLAGLVEEGQGVPAS